MPSAQEILVELEAEQEELRSALEKAEGALRQHTIFGASAAGALLLLLVINWLTRTGPTPEQIELMVVQQVGRQVSQRLQGVENNLGRKFDASLDSAVSRKLEHETQKLERQIAAIGDEVLREVRATAASGQTAVGGGGLADAAMRLRDGQLTSGGAGGSGHTSAPRAMLKELEMEITSAQVVSGKLVVELKLRTKSLVDESIWFYRAPQASNPDPLAVDADGNTLPFVEFKFGTTKIGNTKVTVAPRQAKKGRAVFGAPADLRKLNLLRFVTTEGSFEFFDVPVR